MQIPAVMFIEMGADSLNRVPQENINSERKELHSFGDRRAQQIGASGTTEDFTIGYLLGLQTARIMLISNATLALAKIKPDSLL